MSDSKKEFISLLFLLTALLMYAIYLRTDANIDVELIFAFVTIYFFGQSLIFSKSIKVAIIAPVVIGLTFFYHLNIYISLSSLCLIYLRDKFTVSFFCAVVYYLSLLFFSSVLNSVQQFLYVLPLLIIFLRDMGKVEINHYKIEYAYLYTYFGAYLIYLLRPVLADYYLISDLFKMLFCIYLLVFLLKNKGHILNGKSNYYILMLLVAVLFFGTDSHYLKTSISASLLFALLYPSLRFGSGLYQVLYSFNKCKKHPLLKTFSKLPMILFLNYVLISGSNQGNVFDIVYLSIISISITIITLGICKYDEYLIATDLSIKEALVLFASKNYVMLLIIVIASWLVDIPDLSKILIGLAVSTAVLACCTFLEKLQIFSVNKQVTVRRKSDNNIWGLSKSIWLSFRMSYFKTLKTALGVNMVLVETSSAALSQTLIFIIAFFTIYLLLFY